MHTTAQILHDKVAPARPAMITALRLAGADTDRAAILADLAMAAHADALDAIMTVADRAPRATGLLSDSLVVMQLTAQLLPVSLRALECSVKHISDEIGGAAGSVTGKIDLRDGSFTPSAEPASAATAAE